MANIRATIQLGYYPSNDDLTVAIGIDQFKVNRVSEPIDYPSVNADPVTAVMCCTPLRIRLETIAERREFAQYTASMLTDYIMEALSKKDTEMGYPKPKESA